MGAALGGGGSASVFGGRGAQTFLGKVTSACAGIFMLTSLTLAYQSTHGGSVVKLKAGSSAPASVPVPVPVPVPANGAPAAPNSAPPPVPVPAGKVPATSDKAPSAPAPSDKAPAPAGQKPGSK